jgi:hypothetical protein
MKGGEECSAFASMPKVSSPESTSTQPSSSSLPIIPFNNTAGDSDYDDDDDDIIGHLVYKSSNTAKLREAAATAEEASHNNNKKRALDDDTNTNSYAGGLCEGHKKNPKKYTHTPKGCGNNIIDGGILCPKHSQVAIAMCSISGCFKIANGAAAGLCEEHQALDGYVDYVNSFLEGGERLSQKGGEDQVDHNSNHSSSTQMATQTRKIIPSNKFPLPSY